MTNSSSTDHGHATLSDTAKNVLSWIVIAIGILTTGVALVMFFLALRARRSSLGKREVHSIGGGLRIEPPPSPMPTIGFLLKCILPWAPFFRTVDLLVDLLAYNGNYLTRPWQSQSWLIVLTTSFPTYLLMSNYLLLVIFWIWLRQMSHNRTSLFVNNLIYTWLICTGLMFLVWIILMMLMAALPNYIHLIHSIEVIYASALSFIVAASFALWGYCLIDRIHHTSTATRESQRIAWKIFMLTLFCTILFLIRSLLILLCYYVLENDQIAFFVLLVFWIVACENLPTLFMIGVLSAVSRKKKPVHEDQHSSLMISS